MFPPSFPPLCLSFFQTSSFLFLPNLFIFSLCFSLCEYFTAEKNSQDLKAYQQLQLTLLIMQIIEFESQTLRTRKEWWWEEEERKKKERKNSVGKERIVKGHKNVQWKGQVYTSWWRLWWWFSPIKAWSNIPTTKTHLSHKWWKELQWILLVSLIPSENEKKIREREGERKQKVREKNRKWDREREGEKLEEMCSKREDTKRMKRWEALQSNLDEKDHSLVLFSWRVQMQEKHSEECKNELR